MGGGLIDSVTSPVYYTNWAGRLVGLLAGGLINSLTFSVFYTNWAG